MPQFDIVFEKLEALKAATNDSQITIDVAPSVQELNEIEELRRFSAEIKEPEPTSFTTT